MRRLGIITDTDPKAVNAARDQAVATLEELSGPFADAVAWTTWR